MPAARELPDGVEPVAVEEEDRHTLLPLRHPRIFKRYKRLEHLTWVAQEVDLSLDRLHFDTYLNAGERELYKYVFGMFGPADEKIMRNLGERFLREFKLLELQYYFRQQAQNEQVHSESYSLQILTLFDDDQDVFNAVLNLPVIGKMMNWVDTWIGSTKPLATRTVAFGLFEGGMFQPMFLLIQLLKVRNIMPGVTTLNELINRDEGDHCENACALLREDLVHKPSQEEVNRIVQEVVDLLDEFFDEAIGAAKRAMGLGEEDPCPVQNVSAERMRQYVRHVNGVVVARMGYKDPYGVPNPYPEADALSRNGVAKTNFFEAITTQYSHDVNYTFRAAPARCRNVSIWTT